MDGAMVFQEMVFQGKGERGCGRIAASGLSGWDEAEPLACEEPGSGGGTAVSERPRTEESARLDDGGEADRFSHYVSRERIAESRLTGRPVVALCGKVWVPRRDPKDYPVCPDCTRIYEEMKAS